MSLKFQYNQPGFFKKILRKTFERLSYYLRKVMNITYVYKYNTLSIELPYDSMLPLLQQQHKKYDRFLPHLVKYIESEATVIDVGANCGDTLAGMFENNSKITYVCIEPDNLFFRFLENNILRIKRTNKSANIYSVKALVGKNITNVSLEGKKGSKHAVINNNENGLLSSSLDDILKNIPCSNIRLVKSDVDGFDYDVIESGEMLLATQHPLIFFECQFDFDSQKLGFENIINKLIGIGYKNWIVFDNFGEIILQTDNIDILMQLISYVWKQNIYGATRTIYYYDMLAFTNNDYALVEQAVNKY